MRLPHWPHLTERLKTASKDFSSATSMHGVGKLVTQPAVEENNSLQECCCHKN